MILPRPVYLEIDRPRQRPAVLGYFPILINPCSTQVAKFEVTQVQVPRM
jgi:hypothetical protein